MCVFVFVCETERVGQRKIEIMCVCQRRNIIEWKQNGYLPKRCHESEGQEREIERERERDGCSDGEK